jgi:SAM-dependent methyltransferase
MRGLHRASLAAATRVRRSFAIERHVRGSGIEVGAGAAPALVPLGCQVKYVDKYPGSRLRDDPHLSGLGMQNPDIIDSAETLATVPADSQDFVLAFSLLEHVQDALGTIAAFHRVTKAEGHIVVSIPDKRHYGPDRHRPLTEFSHFERDYREGPEWSRQDHFLEVGRICRGLQGEELDRFASELIALDAHTHFHVWDPESFLAFLLEGKRVLGIGYEIVEFASYEHECLTVLRVHK